MITNKEDFKFKELVKTLLYTTASQNREAYCNEVINGRTYIKTGTLQAVTVVGNVYKIYNSENEMTEYWMFCGISKQNPRDINCNKKVAVEAAQSHALFDPDMIIKVSKSFGENSFRDMMRAYINDMDLEFIKTADEIKLSENNHE